MFELSDAFLAGAPSLQMVGLEPVMFRVPPWMSQVGEAVVFRSVTRFALTVPEMVTVPLVLRNSAMSWPPAWSQSPYGPGLPGDVELIDH